MDAEDQDVFREFVANRSTALLRTAVLLSGGDRHAAEDLLQNALVKVANRWHRIDEPEAYVRQVLYRQQVSRWRLKGRRKELTVAEPPEGAAGGDGTGAAELRLVIRGALARLTTRQRTVLVLRYFEDLPEAEVARMLGCSVGTVRSTTHRSLARLRALVPEWGALDEPAGPDSPHAEATGSQARGRPTTPAPPSDDHRGDASPASAGTPVEVRP
ncbi:RNA polymerase sigma-70 factor, sigma-E family [Actinacidiphila yanglinensis]|uniref:RNA polymerase sigma-70 factor, sigma-E family n=1 Tax=Actinacidiphila yanglinensis TaxID=310779 RepID=A0A1H6AJV1_9ACTN|nr:SigE family RNA polymerase sigma factor [Actinacidiphila yanglinensis]SEG48682.1 RNA polymerase sigma-70 factor, sigma-E family [Actinacidiphila yanglinensis]